VGILSKFRRVLEHSSTEIRGRGHDLPFIVYRKPPVRPGVPKSFSDESLMVYKNLLG
jgi:hypothetical protein